MLCRQSQRGRFHYRMGRTHYEAGAGEMGGGSRRTRQPARVGRAGSNELSEAASQRPRGNHSARCSGTFRDCPQHSAHGLGAPYCTKTRSRNNAKRLKCEPWLGETQAREPSSQFPVLSSQRNTKTLTTGGTEEHREENSVTLLIHSN